MLRTADIRLRGRIPNRQRDWRLWSLLLAAALHASAIIVVSAVQALAWWLSAFGISPPAAPPVPLSAADSSDKPFLILDDVDEYLNEHEPADAYAQISRDARQSAPAPEMLPAGAAFRASGIEETLTRQTPGTPGWSEPPPPAAAAAAPPAPTPPPMAPARPDARQPPEHEAATAAKTDRIDPVEPLEPEKLQTAESVDMTSLPPDPHSPLPPPARRPPPGDAAAAGAEESTTRAIPAAPSSSPELPPSREARPAPPLRPPVKRIGETPARPGEMGSPARANTRSRAMLADGDNVMRTLRHRYGEYMAEVGKRLEQSVRREEVLNPRMYRRGAIGIRFGIGGDGELSFHEILRREDGMGLEQAMAERVLTGAAPFPRQTEEMKRDPLFQQLTFILFIE